MPNLQAVKNVASFLLLSLITCSSSGLYAQIGGRGVFQFLDVVSSPRVTGLGGKAVAFDEADLNFALWNPALLQEGMHGQLGFNHMNYPAGISTGEASYVYHWEKIGTFQAGFRYFDYGTFDAADFQGIQQGTFTAADYAFLLAGNRQIDSNWSVGVQAKVINSVLETYTSWGLAADVGIVYRIPRQRLAFSLLLRNMGGQTETYAGVQEPLPFEIQFGISNKFEHMPFRWQVTFEHLQQWDLSYFNPNGSQTDPLTGEPLDQELNFGEMLLRHVVIGAEFQPVKAFHFQVGYSFRRRAEMRMLTRRSSAGLSFGFGLRLFKVYFNYARSIQHVAGSNNHISLTADLGNFKRKKD